jgi:hypothetical protein
LEQDREFDFGPEPVTSGAAFLAQFSAENDPFGFAKHRHLEKMKKYYCDVDEYNENKPKIYNVIWGQCTVAMKQKIRGDPELYTMEADKNPLVLWIRIKAASLHGTMSANKVKIREHASKRFNSFTQYGSETSGDFYERFNIEYQAFNASSAEIIQVPYMPEDAAAKQELEDRVINQEDEILAYKFLSKLDKRRYGHLLDELNNGSIKYPKKLTEAY